MLRENNKITIGLIIVMIAAPLLVGYRHAWSWEYMKTPIYIDAAVMAVISLLFYQKYLIVYGFAFLLSWASFNIEDHSAWSNILVPVTFWLVYLGCWLVYFEISRSRIGQNIKLWHPALHFLYYLAFMLLAVIVSILFVTHAFDIPLSLQTIPGNYYLFFLGMMFIIPTLTSYLLNIINTVGSKHIFHILIGTYKRPVETMRVVLFIDMVGSTRIAEKLSPQKSMELISRFIFDASYIFRVYGGELINYTGDGLVVVWPIGKEKNALRSISALEKRLLKYEKDYKKNYNHIPSFRAGIHAGKVVLSQVGEDRLFLSLYGDVVNTAARLEQMNKRFGTNVLMSDYARRLFRQDDEYNFKSLGEQEIIGKEQDLEIFTVDLLQD
ncbi:MAG: adenylate/guanylate cyclase domain-containing protein [Alphaproteobacteria bacterium]|nr:MAG: adenylate/guanylate cyclase domain-containing protein [Alphaproteobacteria bacterium]